MIAQSECQASRKLSVAVVQYIFTDQQSFVLGLLRWFDSRSILRNTSAILPRSHSNAKDTHAQDKMTKS